MNCYLIENITLLYYQFTLFIVFALSSNMWPHNLRYEYIIKEFFCIKRDIYLSPVFDLVQMT